MNKAELDQADPVHAEGLDDRQQDLWLPLFAIADLIGWGDEARKWAKVLTDAIPKPPDPAVMLLSDIKTVLDGYEGTFIPTAVMAELRNALEERHFGDDVTPMQLGTRLAGFGIQRDNSPKRLAGKASKPVRGFTFRRGGKYVHQWQDAFMRYGLATPDTGESR
jgi:hypothetical protein